MNRVRHLSAALVFACSGIAGCSTPDASVAGRDTPPSTVTETGTLTLPLEVSSGGKTYRLALSFYVYGLNSYYFNWFSTDVYSTEASFIQQLSAGDYQIGLQSWQVYRLDAGGYLQNVQANLTSPSYQAFTIQNNTRTTLDFVFETDGATLHTGSGSLAVTAHVNQGAPVCTILGTDCGSGYWCPPPELTGRTLACVYDTGTKQLSESCSGPTDCAANSSCYDFGSGPACAALCLSADFDQPCESGGTCVAQGQDYGVCFPSSTTGALDSGLSDSGPSDGGLSDGG